MQLDDLVRRVPGQLVEPIDILGDETRDMGVAPKPGQSQVGRIGLSRPKTLPAP